VEDSFKYFCVVWTLVSELMTKGFYIWHGLFVNKEVGVPSISWTVDQQGNGCAFDFIIALLHEWFCSDLERLCQWSKSTVWTRFFVVDTAAGTLQPFFNRGMAIQRKKVVCCKFMSLQFS
jgi:hypothetical protein